MLFLIFVLLRLLFLSFVCLFAKNLSVLSPLSAIVLLVCCKTSERNSQIVNLGFMKKQPHILIRNLRAFQKAFTDCLVLFV